MTEMRLRRRSKNSPALEITRRPIAAAPIYLCCSTFATAKTKQRAMAPSMNFSYPLIGVCRGSFSSAPPHLNESPGPEHQDQRQQHHYDQRSPPGAP